MAALPPREVEMRSHHSDPPPSLHQRPTHFLEQREAAAGPVSRPGIEGMVAPLSSTRLRPTRQKTKNAVANISGSGEVCLEFLKTRGGEERVVDVMRISADGQRVVVYTPGQSRAEGVPVGTAPAPIPGKGADAFFSYQSLPEKYWKKYQYAERFVTLVKAKTPKITMYTRQAKCYLMENSDCDFEVYFYSGVKATLSGSGPGREVRLAEGAASHRLAWPLRQEAVPGPCLLHIQHFSHSLVHCTRLEATLAALDSPDHPVFPVIFGR
jgi:polo-like kinase 4